MDGMILLIVAFIVAIAMIALGERAAPERAWERVRTQMPDRYDTAVSGNRLRLICPECWNPYREALEI